MWRVFGLAVLVALGGCSGSPDASCAGVAPAKLSDIQASIFSPTCATAGCHTGGFAAQGLRLDPGHSFASLVNVHSTLVPSELLVSPGDPADSYLYSQVADGTMPEDASALSQAQLDQIRGWICAGAPND